MWESIFKFLNVKAIIMEVHHTMKSSAAGKHDWRFFNAECYSVRNMSSMVQVVAVPPFDLLSAGYFIMIASNQQE